MCPRQEVGIENADQAQPHAWKGFTDRAELEALIKATFARFRQTADQAAQLVG